MKFFVTFTTIFLLATLSVCRSATVSNFTNEMQRPCYIGIDSNECIYANRLIYSCHRCFHLVLQTDGNLVVYTTMAGQAVWSTGTAGRGVSRACMQGDGNFVLYTSDNRAAWATNTQNNPGAYLEMQYDGQMAIWRNGKGLYASGVVAQCIKP